MKSDGSSVNAMRSEGQPYFQEHAVLARAIGELSVSSNQLFEMLFVSGHIRPMYAAMLLLIFKCIRRDMEADEVMAVSKSPDDAFERYPFAMAPDSDDDSSIRQFKEFFRALYLAWGLGARLLLDV